MKRLLPPSLVVLVTLPASAAAVDLDAVNRIRDEALNRSQVMELARQITDELGPRLTGSPAMKAANEWARGKLAGWGLADARLEPYEFGEGWSYRRCEVRMVVPQEVPLWAVPRAWTPGTAGTVRGRVERVELEKEEDLEQQRGKLVGRILLLDAPFAAEADAEPPFERYDAERLAEVAELELRESRTDWLERRRKRVAFSRTLNEFLVAEGVVATIEISSRDFGVVRVGGDSASRDPGHPRGVPSVGMAVEPYQRLLRLVEAGQPVELELTIDATFHSEDTRAYNTLADLAGSSRTGELVMAGAHLDSWHSATGATDNAAGVAVVMEAARILKAIGVRPARTIRFALWSGEEQGLLGARAYVERHVADRPEPTDEAELALPRSLRRPTWPIRAKAEHGRISAYYNLDNGGGQVRGIYTQGNVAVAPIFAEWFAPLADLGMGTVSNRSVRSTDHAAFDDVGVPGFQFIQDPLDYRLRTHHSHLDTYERLRREDLIKSSIALATFLLETANHDAALPRKPMPQPPAEKPERRPDAGGEPNR